MLSFLVGFSAVFATSEGIKASQSKARREEHRSRKNNLVVHCPRSSRYSPLLEGRRVVLSGNKVGTYPPSQPTSCSAPQSVALATYLR